MITIFASNWLSMSILLKSAKIVDAKSKFNGKTQDILIDKGKIQEISSNISDSKG